MLTPALEHSLIIIGILWAQGPVLRGSAVAEIQRTARGKKKDIDLLSLPSDIVTDT